MLVGWAFGGVTGTITLTYPISGDDGDALLRSREGQNATAIRSNGNRETLAAISRIHAGIVAEARNWEDAVRLRSRVRNDDAQPA